MGTGGRGKAPETAYTLYAAWCFRDFEPQFAYSSHGTLRGSLGVISIPPAGCRGFCGIVTRVCRQGLEVRRRRVAAVEDGAGGLCLRWWMRIV